MVHPGYFKEEMVEMREKNGPVATSSQNYEELLPMGSIQPSFPWIC